MSDRCDDIVCGACGERLWPLTRTEDGGWRHVRFTRCRQTRPIVRERYDARAIRLKDPSRPPWTNVSIGTFNVPIEIEMLVGEGRARDETRPGDRRARFARRVTGTTRFHFALLDVSLSQPMYIVQSSVESPYSGDDVAAAIHAFGIAAAEIDGRVLKSIVAGGISDSRWPSAPEIARRLAIDAQDTARSAWHHYALGIIGDGLAESLVGGGNVTFATDAIDTLLSAASTRRIR